jgi:hypothetical protein
MKRKVSSEIAGPLGVQNDLIEPSSDPQMQETSPQLEIVLAAARTNLNNEETQELEELIIEYGNIYNKNSDYEPTNRVYQYIESGDARLIP